LSEEIGDWELGEAVMGVLGTMDGVEDSKIEAE